MPTGWSGRTGRPLPLGRGRRLQTRNRDDRLPGTPLPPLCRSLRRGRRADPWHHVSGWRRWRSSAPDRPSSGCPSTSRPIQRLTRHSTVPWPDRKGGQAIDRFRGAAAAATRERWFRHPVERLSPGRACASVWSVHPLRAARPAAERPASGHHPPEDRPSPCPPWHLPPSVFRCLPSRSARARFRREPAAWSGSSMQAFLPASPLAWTRCPFPSFPAGAVPTQGTLPDDR